jgi:hypothetical protein
MSEARDALAWGLAGRKAVDDRLDIGTNPSIATAEPLQLALEGVGVADGHG